MTTRLAGRADAQQLVTLELDRDHALSYRLQDAAPAAGQATGSAVTYPRVRPDADLRINATPGGFKEDLVLHSANAPTTWFFPLQLKGLSAKVVDNAVVLTDAKGTERAVIPAGFMTDSDIDENTGDPATSYGVRYEIVDGNTLKVELDQAWLKDGARKFPVTVDPSVLERKTSTSMFVQRTGNSHFSKSDGLELKVGRAGNINAATYLKFPGIENDLRDHRIFGAQLFLLNYYSWSCRPAPLNVHPVTQDWSAGPGHNYPGPAVGGEVASSSFAQGYIPSGANSSACPATGQAINLGDSRPRPRAALGQPPAGELRPEPARVRDRPVRLEEDRGPRQRRPADPLHHALAVQRELPHRERRPEPSGHPQPGRRRQGQGHQPRQAHLEAGRVLPRVPPVRRARWLPGRDRGRADPARRRRAASP